MFRFIHCSDWHLPLPPKSAIGGWRLKQILGRISWATKRRHQYRREVLDAAMSVWCEAKVDRVCVTGDLVNFARPVEYATAVEYLRRIERTSPVSLVPGNHDALVRQGLAEQRFHWDRWLQGDDATEQEWPAVTIHGPVAFIGLSSSIPTPPFCAQGAVAPAQLVALEERLHGLKQRGFFRVVMVHHAPQSGAIGWRASLRNIRALRAVLIRAGAELILHGHLHHPVRASVPGPVGPIPVLGAGSASSCRARGRADRGHFYLFTLEQPDTGGWRLLVKNYFYDAAEGGFEAGADVEIGVPRLTNPPQEGAAE